MIKVLQWGLERSVCISTSFYETDSPLFNQDKIVLIDNETIADLEKLGFIVSTVGGN